MQKSHKRTSVGSINQLDNLCKQRELQRKQREWEFALNDYEISKRLLNLAKTIGRGESVKYWVDHIQDLETKFPRLLK